MEEILKKNPFGTQIALLKTRLETFAVGLKNSWNKKEEKTFFFSNRVCLLKAFH